MGDRRTGLRLLIALLAGIVLFIEVQALVHVLRFQTVQQRRALARARDVFQAVQPRLAHLLATGQASLEEAAGTLIGEKLASEVDVFDQRGERLFSSPAIAPVQHWPEPEVVLSLRPGGTPLVVGPFVGPSPRLLTYGAFHTRTDPALVVIRLSTDAATLVGDLRDMRPLLVGHGIGIALLAIMVGAALLPRHEAATASAPAPALDAYEEAMERLRDQGEAKDRAHAAERSRLQDLFRDREAMARAGELTAGIVHEVRNGLGTIVGYARLAEKHEEAPQAAEAARAILEECRTLETVARRFMDFVKDETLNLTPVDVARLLARVAARESRSRPDARVTLEPSPGLAAVAGDEEMLERAFENVIRNACEAAGKGGHVRIGAVLEADGWMRVRVADDGPGLPPDQRVPRPFRTTKPGGLGLGLPMVAKIVELHQGELAFEEASPRGLEVLVRLRLTGPPA